MSTEVERLLREGSGDDLTRALTEAPAALCALALGNPELEESQLLLLLRRPDLPQALLQQVADDKTFLGSYLVKAALVGHARVPKVVAMQLTKFLFWRDLARLAGNHHAHPSVRRFAELQLAERLQEMSLGERISLARLAPREVVKSFRREPQERVVAALLDNPRLTEEDVLYIANNRRSPPGHLTLLSRHARWSARHAVRLSLIRNPRAPLATALALLVGLTEPDIKVIASSSAVGEAVRKAAARLLQEREARSIRRP